MSFRVRLYLACLAFAAWTALLWIGGVAGGWTHALLVVALVVCPWRAAVSTAASKGARSGAEEPP